MRLSRWGGARGRDAAPSDAAQAVRGVDATADGATPDALVPPGFTSLASALLHEDDAAVSVVARELAERYASDGVPLRCLLSDIDVLHRILRRGEPSGRLTRHLCEAWATGFESSMGALSCVDPLTGLATISHLRLRLIELYRQPSDEVPTRRERSVPVGHVLVVVTLRERHLTSEGGSLEVLRSLRLALVGKTLHAVMTGSETVAAIGLHRVVAVLPDDGTANEQVRRMEQHLLQDVGPEGLDVEVLTLPPDLDEALAVVHSLPETSRHGLVPEAS